VAEWQFYANEIFAKEIVKNISTIFITQHGNTTKQEKYNLIGIEKVIIPPLD